MNRIHPISAVILSAGFSERMGCFKPLMDLGGQRVVERVVSLYRSAGVSDIRVVVGHRAAEMETALVGSGVQLVFNRNFESGMYASVAEGVRHLPPDCRAFFIHPVDIPLVRVTTVTALLKAFHPETGKICYPLFDGQRGHPPLIAADMGYEILAYPGTGGLRALLERHEGQAVDVPVVDEAVLFDLDTPEDRSFLLARREKDHIPTPAECRWLMQRICGLPVRIIDHCHAVARIATVLAESVARAGCDMDVALVHTAALVHDAGRGEKSHAAAGAGLLREWGFPGVADIIRVHMDIVVSETLPPTEAEIVYLADKLVAGDRRVDLAKRFGEKIRRYEKDAQAVAAIRRRLDNAQKIQAKVERITGRPLERIPTRCGS